MTQLGEGSASAFAPKSALQAADINAIRRTRRLRASLSRHGIVCTARVIERVTTYVAPPPDTMRGA
jgi:hypothetical protein